MFPQYSIEIDFNNPELSINNLIGLTSKVENECPIGKYFGVLGTGEGIVWTHLNKDGSLDRFKVKGGKHSVTKVKKLTSVNTEKLESINAFIDYALTENRLLQAVENTLQLIIDEYDFDRKNLGTFIKWITKDVYTEEVDTLKENNLDMKDIGNQLSKRSREWFFKQEVK